MSTTTRRTNKKQDSLAIQPVVPPIAGVVEAIGEIHGPTAPQEIRFPVISKWFSSAINTLAGTSLPFVLSDMESISDASLLAYQDAGINNMVYQTMLDEPVIMYRFNTGDGRTIARFDFDEWRTGENGEKEKPGDRIHRLDRKAARIARREDTVGNTALLTSIRAYMAEAIKRAEGGTAEEHALMGALLDKHVCVSVKPKDNVLRSSSGGEYLVPTTSNRAMYAKETKRIPPPRPTAEEKIHMAREGILSLAYGLASRIKSSPAGHDPMEVFFPGKPGEETKTEQELGRFNRALRLGGYRTYSASDVLGYANRIVGTRNHETCAWEGGARFTYNRFLCDFVEIMPVPRVEEPDGE